MSTGPVIEPIHAGEIPKLLEIKWSIFAPYYSNKKACDDYTLASVDWDISVKLTYHGSIIGMYLLRAEAVSAAVREERITTLYETLDRYTNLRGIQGVTLALHEAFRGRGWGTLLKEYPKTLSYEYWWGIAFKTLGNLRDWQKRARLVGENQELYLLLEDL